MNTFVKCLAATLALFAAAGADAEPIRLQAATLMPEAPGTARAVCSAASLPERGVYLIQHKGTIPAGWRRKIAEHGGTVYGYIPENAYLVGIAAADYAALAEGVEHSYLGEFLPEWKYDAAAVERKLAGDAVFSVSLFEASERGAVAAAVRAAAGCEVLAEGGVTLRTRLTREGIAAVSRMWAVHWIEPYALPSLANNVAVDENMMNVRAVWPGSETGLGLTGKGQIVGVCDGGLDTGDLATVHKDVRGRIVAAFDVVGDGDWGDTDGHGTHVVGSVLGNGTMSNGEIKGVAYEAKLVFQGAGIAEYPHKVLIPDLTELFDQAYTNGARIHSDSYGAGEMGDTDLNALYTGGAHDIDKFMFEHPDMLILFGAGNNGIDVNPTNGVIDIGFSLTQQATAKNSLAVGAAETFRKEFTNKWSGSDVFWTTNGTLQVAYRLSPIKDDYDTQPYDDVHQGMAAFSSRGPCRDGRIKPDIVAPGTGILSLSCQGEEFTLKPQDSHCHDSHYRYQKGTSMATPLVAGGAALVRQWLAEEWGIGNPDGATVKALLLAGAKSLSPGQYGTGEYREIPAAYPNNVEGWGQANLRNTVEPQGGIFILDGGVIGVGGKQTFLVQGTPGTPLTIVMAYTDAPGLPSADQTAAKLVNDLDLKVVSPGGRTFHPNSRSGRDPLNNVEGVRIAGKDVEKGTYTVLVEAWSIPKGMDTSLTGGAEDATRYSLAALGGWSRSGGKGRVYFDGNGGTAGEASREVWLGQPLGGDGQELPTAATGVAGMAFAGWWTERVGGHRVTEDTVVGKLGVTLYAHWTTANDERWAAIEIQGESGSADGDTSRATRDNPDPLVEHLAASATNTIWYVWTSPKDGPVRFSTEGSAIRAVIGVSKLASGNLAWVGGNVGGEGAGTSGVSFRAEKDASYYIEIAGRNGQRGMVKLNWAMFDDVNAVFDGNGGTVSSTEGGAESAVIQKKVFWGLPLRESGPLPLPVRASGMPGNPKDYRADGWWTAPDGGERVTESTVPDCDTTYYMHWKPDNDLTTRTTMILGQSGSLEISTRNATCPEDDPIRVWSVGTFTNTVWYRFTPTVGGRYFFDASASTAPDGGALVPIIAAFTNTNGWEHVEHNRDKMTLRAEAGTTYFIGVGGYGPKAPYGTVRLSWSHPIWLELFTPQGMFPSGSSMRSVPIAVGVPIGEEALSVIPARDDYAFDGWWTQQEGGEPVTAKSLFFENENWVYAHWRPRPANNRPTYAAELETGYGIYGGTVSIPNEDAGSEGNDPLVRGHEAERTLWWTFWPKYQGIVRFDTIGSTQPDGKDLDTVLGIYTWKYENDTFVYTETAFNDDMIVKADVEFTETRPVSAVSVPVEDEALMVGVGMYPDKPAGELVLNWTYEKFLVGLDLAGGTLSGGNTNVYLPANVPLGAALHSIPVPTRERYEWIGWSVYNSRPNVTEETVIPENWTLKANWAPRNDRFGNAQILNPPHCFDDFWSVSNKNATVQAGEPMVGIENISRTLWYRWTPKSDGTAMFTTSNSVTEHGTWLDTLLGVYTGDSLSNLVEVAFSDNATIGWAENTPASLVEFEAVGGTPYFICVGTREDTVGRYEGNVLLSWSLSHRVVFDANGGTLAGGGETLEVAAKHGGSVDLPKVSRPGWTFLGWRSDGGTDLPAWESFWSADSNCVWRAQWEEGISNDNFAGARAISGPSGSLEQSNGAATTEEGEPLAADSRYGTPQSLWWTWTAPAGGIAVFTTDGSTYLGSDPDTNEERIEEYPTMLGIYTGDSLGSLATVALDYAPKYDEEGHARYTSSNRFEVAKGTVYRIAAAGSMDRKNMFPQSTIVLNWHYESMEEGASITPLAPSAGADEVEAAAKAAGFADPGVPGAIGGSVERWNDFAAWANGTIGDADAVLASPHAAASWLLGTSALLENDPEVAIDGAAVASVEGCKAMTLSVAVKDGGTPVEVTAAKVAALVEATTDPADWESPENRLDPHAEAVTTGSASTVTIRVSPAGGSALRAFLRIAQ